MTDKFNFFSLAVSCEQQEHDSTVLELFYGEERPFFVSAIEPFPSTYPTSPNLVKLG